MKIRTQFITTLALFGCIVLVISASMVITNRRVAELDRQEEIVHHIERGASELGYLFYDYLLYHEDQQRRRWEIKFASLSDAVSRLEPSSPEQQALLDSIKANHRRLGVIFADIALVLSERKAFPDSAAELAFIQISWSRVAVVSEGIVFDGLRLSQRIHDEADQLKQTNLLLIYAMAGLFGAYFLANYYLFYRRTLRDIADLQVGTGIIGSGNLDFAIAVKRDDEIGELSRAFNRMADNLKRVTASKAELEKEIAERKRAEESRLEALRQVEQLNRDLAKHASELEAANKELESFSYSVSHDLRTPLASIDGFSKLLLADYGSQLPGVAQRYLQLIRDGTAAMECLIQDLLSLSRASRQPLKKDSIDTAELVHQVLDELRPAQEGRDIEFIIGDPLAERALPACEADPVLLKQVWMNLLSNAIKFTRQRERARIQVGSGQWPVDSNLTTAHYPLTTVFYVRDNGVGFDMEYAGQLFGAFQRLHSEDDFEGTGVGLAIVTRIVHRHGGQVWAEGEPGQGATFYFTLAGQEPTRELASVS